MRLRFVGQDKSMGLQFGRIYRLSVRPHGAGVMVVMPIRCPYDSEEAFWRNWLLPNADLRTFMQTGSLEMVATMSRCFRTELHGSHNWKNELETTLWCPGSVKENAHG